MAPVFIGRRRILEYTLFTVAGFIYATSVDVLLLQLCFLNGTGKVAHSTRVIIYLRRLVLE